MQSSPDDLAQDLHAPREYKEMPPPGGMGGAEPMPADQDHEAAAPAEAEAPSAEDAPYESPALALPVEAPPQEGPALVLPVEALPQKGPALVLPVEAPPRESPATSPPKPADPVVAEPFVAFHRFYGPSLCGAPVSELTQVDGRPAQYFENLALVAGDDGRVRPLPIGEAAFEALAPALNGTAPVADQRRRVIEDLTSSLPQHPRLRYAQRPLAQIRHLVIHHTGTSPAMGPFEVAREHADVNKWPGIGYHFFVGVDGRTARTQPLSVETYHARQFNPAAVGIALAGDYASQVPPAAQLEAAAEVLADLLRDLGLPTAAIRGHREIVTTPCPGETFLTLWKPRLVRLVEARLAAIPKEALVV